MIAAIFRDIKPAHTVFALPFGLAGAILAFRYSGFLTEQGFDLHLFAWKIVWIVVAAFGARSAAMAFNRLADADIDAKNPRTANRPIPAGLVSKKVYVVFIAAMSALFVLASWMLNSLALALSPVAIVIVCGYSLTKRFTAMTHFVLGLCLALTPVGAWVAVTGQLTGMEVPLLLGAAVLFWVAGFDMIYACQDYETDKGLPVRSFPKSFGIAGALRASALSHAATAGLLVVLWAVTPSLGMIFIAGLVLASVFLIIEHIIVRPEDLSRVGTAFLALNGLVSLTLSAAIILDALFCP